MKIKELEENLGITRANIRYYEKEGLIDPSRSENGYRDYSKEDEEKLRTIILLRKLGVSISDIRLLLAGNKSLGTVITDTVTNLETKLEELKGAIEVCHIIEDSEVEMDNFDTNYYRTIIESKEAQGSKFLDVCNDLVEYERDIFDQELGLDQFPEHIKKNPFKTLLFVLVSCLGCGSLWFMLGRTTQDFIEGFTFPLICALISMVLYLPGFFLGRKKATWETNYKKLINWAVIILGIVIIILVIIL